MTASELKKLVTQVRRTDTALRHLAAQLDLNEADKASLLKAASVLSASGRQVATQVAQTRRTEEAREKAIARATQEARQLMAGWQVVSISDKVALCVANLMETHLRQNLASDFDNLEWSLNYWVEQAPRGDTDERRLEGSEGRQAGERTHGTGKRAVGQDSNSTRNNCAGPALAGADGSRCREPMKRSEIIS
jgi:hypothetical protein